MGTQVQVGDTIVRAMYARDSTLHFGEVTEVKPSGAIRMDCYYQDGNGGFNPAVYRFNVAVKTQYLILNDIKLR